ncbi:MAG: hypothetical protein ABI239_12190 [Aquihabitans sp.]
MSESTADRRVPWWHRRGPSLLVFMLVVAVVAGAVVVVSRQVADVLGEVPKDELGEDNWVDQLGIELGGGLQVAQVPECAADPITRIALWDADSNPYWEAAGPPTPLTSFVIGAAPAGFTEIEPYRQPAEDELVRLVVFRRVGGVAGMRYRAIDLVDGKVISGRPIRTYTREGFRTEKVCDTPAVKQGLEATTESEATDPDVGSDTAVVPD